MNDLTVLVNTSDGFHDCWDPFFSLFRTYWPNCGYPIVLNTESRQYSFPGVRLRCSRVATGQSARLTWSECLARCLDSIDTPFILYLQEDYFLEDCVKSELIDSFLGELRANRADVVRIMECGGSGPWHPTDNPLLWRVDQRAKYRISLQAALWRKCVLLNHLRKHESPWQLEVFGSARARRQASEIVLCVNRDRFHGPGKEILPYTPTGIVKGKWARSIVEPLFARHSIEVDFDTRGFYDPKERQAPTQSILSRMLDRIRSLH